MQLYSNKQYYQSKQLIFGFNVKVIPYQMASLPLSLSLQRRYSLGLLQEFLPSFPV